VQITLHIHHINQMRCSDVEHCPVHLRYNGKPSRCQPPTLTSLVGKLPPAPPPKPINLKTLHEQCSDPSGQLEKLPHKHPNVPMVLHKWISAARQSFSKSTRLAAMTSMFQQTLPPALGVLAGSDASLLDQLEEMGELGNGADVRFAISHTLVPRRRCEAPAQMTPGAYLPS
jgi:hypothetical protein